MKRDQAESATKLIQSVLPTQASVKVFSHGDKTPAGYFISIVAGGEQRVVHNVGGVADYLKTAIGGARDGGTPKPVTTGAAPPASHASNGAAGNGARQP